MTPTVPSTYAALLLLALPASPLALSPMSSGPLVLHRRPTEASLAHSGEGASLCAQGKLVPELYVLGAKNTASTSLFSNLLDKGVISAPGNLMRDGHFKKEWEFFQMKSFTDEDALFEKWIGALRQCPMERMVLADYSVVNLFTIKMPSDLTWSQEYGYPARSNTDETGWNTPKYIKDFYSKVGARTPKFVVMLRHPTERIQSEFYHNLENHNCFGCNVSDTFADAFAFNVGLLQRTPPQLSDWFWKSFYARQVEAYLDTFDAKHFAFVPNKEYLSIDPAAFSKELLSWIGLEKDPWQEAKHENAHPSRPRLDEELPPDNPSRAAYEAFMAPELDRLVKVMTQAHLRGAWLAGYAGSEGDEAQVRAWLERGW